MDVGRAGAPPKSPIRAAFSSFALVAAHWHDAFTLTDDRFTEEPPVVEENVAVLPPPPPLS